MESLLAGARHYLEARGREHEIGEENPIPVWMLFRPYFLTSSVALTWR